MHVAFLTDVALPYVSGVTIAVKRQRDALRAAGVAVTVVGPRGDVDIAETDLQAPGAPPGYRVALFGPGLGAKLHERGVDVVHAHSIFGASGAALSLSKGQGLPFVVTIHTRFDEYVHYVKAAAPLAKALLNPYVATVLSAAHCVIAPCAEIADQVRATGSARAVHVVAAPIDPELADGDAARGRTRAGVGEGIPLLLSTSRLAQEKRVLDLVDAVAALGRRDAVLVFAGAGPLADDLARRARERGVADRVRLLGQLGTAELADVLAAADVVVSASRSETQGLALCEAAAAGCAIVAPRRGGYAETLEGGGGMFPGPAPAADELADAIGGLLDDVGLREGLGGEARRRAVQAWSASVTAEGLRSAYADAATMRK